MASVGSSNVSVDDRALRAAFKRLGDTMQGDAQASAIMAGGLVVEGAMKENIVRYDFIDTGATINSVAAQVGDSSGDEATSEIGPETEYAIFGELGIGQSEKPFAREALEQNQRQIAEAVAAELREVLRRAVGRGNVS